MTKRTEHVEQSLDVGKQIHSERKTYIYHRYQWKMINMNGEIFCPQLNLMPLFFTWIIPKTYRLTQNLKCKQHISTKSKQHCIALLPIPWRKENMEINSFIICLISTYIIWFSPLQLLMTLYNLILIFTGLKVTIVLASINVFTSLSDTNY